MMNHNELLSETLRPQSIDDLILPQRILSPLKRMVEGGSIMNLLLYGKAGTGKTSAANLLTRHCDVYDASSVSFKTEDVMNKKMAPFVTSVSITGQPKALLINEADRIPPSAQADLLDLMEKCQKNTRFVFTTNQVEKMILGIKSRCVLVAFDAVSRETDDLVRKATLNYETRLRQLDYKYEPKRLWDIVAIYFPDYRAIANQIEFEFTR